MKQIFSIFLPLSGRTIHCDRFKLREADISSLTEYTRSVLDPLNIRGIKWTPEIEMAIENDLEKYAVTVESAQCMNEEDRINESNE